MRVFVIPDIHLKPQMLFTADDLIDKGHFDQLVFLGDFVDDWDADHNTALYNETFDEICGFVRKHPNSLICLGNHDLSYVWGCPESGFSYMMRDTVVARLKELRKLLPPQNSAFIHRIDKVLFSHAGLTRKFVMDHFAYDTDSSIDHIVESINRMGEEELWNDDSPLWARPQIEEIAMYPREYLQVVGHTPVPTASEKDKVLSLDVFSTKRDGTPIGDERFVCVDTETQEWNRV